MATPLIIALFFPRGPAAISWFVWAIIVLTIYAVSRRWALPHIFEERLEISEPLLTNKDASAAIIIPSFIQGICAALFHRNPRAIFRCMNHAVRKTVSSSFHAGAMLLAPFVSAMTGPSLFYRFSRKSHVSVDKPLRLSGSVSVESIGVFRNWRSLPASALTEAKFAIHGGIISEIDRIWELDN